MLNCAVCFWYYWYCVICSNCILCFITVFFNIFCLYTYCSLFLISALSSIVTCWIVTLVSSMIFTKATVNVFFCAIWTAEKILFLCRISAINWCRSIRQSLQGVALHLGRCSPVTRFEWDLYVTSTWWSTLIIIRYWKMTQARKGNVWREPLFSSRRMWRIPAGWTFGEASWIN